MDLANTPVKERFGRYRLLQRLGRGGMAEVWKALDDNDRMLVVKRMLPDLTDSDEILRMFHHECRITTRFRHPGLVMGYEAGEARGEPFLAMEYVEGRNLGQVMDAVSAIGRPPVGFGAFVARELCRALAYAHSLTDDRGQSLRLVHRDISPANVMVGADGSVKLLDFGIAKSREDSSRHTQAGVLKGKLAYLSPEAVEERPLDHRADQFAVGVVLHEMLTGRRLFRAPNHLETLRNVLAADAPAPSTINPAVPPELDRIVLRALARRREDRFPSCRDMAIELGEIVDKMAWTHLEVAHLMRDFYPGNVIVDFDDDLDQEPTTDDHGWGGEATPETAPWWLAGSRKLASQVAMILALFISLGGLTGWRIACGRQASAMSSLSGAVAMIGAVRTTAEPVAPAKVDPPPPAPVAAPVVAPAPAPVSRPSVHRAAPRRAAPQPNQPLFLGELF